MAARRVLLSGYSGAGADIRMAEVSAEGRLRGGEGLRHGENPSFCCWMDGRVYAVAELPQGASVTAYALEGDALRPLGRMELPGRRGLCHLAAVDGVLYGSCYESGHYFALDAELSRVLWEYLPGGTPRAHWAQEAGGLLYLADLGSDRVYRYALQTACPTARWKPCACRRAAVPASPCPSPRAVSPWCASWTACCAFSGRTAPAALRSPPAACRGPTPPGAPAGWATRFSWGTGGPTRSPPSA